MACRVQPRLFHSSSIVQYYNLTVGGNRSSIPDDDNIEYKEKHNGDKEEAHERRGSIFSQKYNRIIELCVKIGRHRRYA